MAKHKIVKNRINNLAKELKEFSTQEIYDRMFFHPNNEGRLFARRRVVSKPRLQNILLANKNVLKIGDSKKAPVTWKWIGEEE